jgi:hypothetical protein
MLVALGFKLKSHSNFLKLDQLIDSKEEIRTTKEL